MNASRMLPHPDDGCGAQRVRRDTLARSWVQGSRRHSAATLGCGYTRLTRAPLGLNVRRRGRRRHGWQRGENQPLTAQGCAKDWLATGGRTPAPCAIESNDKPWRCAPGWRAALGARTWAMVPAPHASRAATAPARARLLPRGARSLLTGAAPAGIIVPAVRASRAPAVLARARPSAARALPGLAAAVHVRPPLADLCLLTTTSAVLRHKS